MNPASGMNTADWLVVGGSLAIVAALAVHAIYAARRRARHAVRQPRHT